jgi:hypothetical protein
MKMVTTVAYCKVIHQNSTEQTDTILLSVLWMHLDFIQKFQATSYTDWCVLLFLALPSKFCIKFSKYDTTVFLQDCACSLFINMSTFHPTLSNVYFWIIAAQKIQDSFSLFFGLFLHSLFNNVVLLGQWLAFSWQNSAQNAIIRLLKCLVRRNLSRLTPCLCLCYSILLIWTHIWLWRVDARREPRVLVVCQTSTSQHAQQIKTTIS